jgi:precorrin-2 dehydrogenase/sirohydrochlorin ferrochelatase
LVVAATDDPEVNQAAWAEASQLSCLVNVVDDPEHSNFIVPAVVQYGELKISISTGGASPALARRLREKLTAAIGPEYGVLAELLAEQRPALRSRFGAGEPRLRAALQMVDSDVLEIIRTQGIQAGRRYLAHFLESLEKAQEEQQA